MISRTMSNTLVVFRSPRSTVIATCVLAGPRILSTASFSVSPFTWVASILTIMSPAMTPPSVGFRRLGNRRSVGLGSIALRFVRGRRRRRRRRRRFRALDAVQQIDRGDQLLVLLGIGRDIGLRTRAVLGPVLQVSLE